MHDYLLYPTRLTTLWYTASPVPYPQQSGRGSKHIRPGSEDRYFIRALSISERGLSCSSLGASPRSDIHRMLKPAAAWTCLALWQLHLDHALYDTLEFGPIRRSMIVFQARATAWHPFGHHSCQERLLLRICSTIGLADLFRQCKRSSHSLEVHT